MNVGVTLKEDFALDWNPLLSEANTSGAGWGCRHFSTSDAVLSIRKYVGDRDANDCDLFPAESFSDNSPSALLPPPTKKSRLKKIWIAMSATEKFTFGGAAI
jgi:hypothetical protein